MNILSRTITGAVIIFGGAILTALPFFLSDKSTFFMWIYGIPFLVIGFFILFNKKEDEIEKIKFKGGKK